MKVCPICKALEDNYISFFKKARCEVKLDENGIHALNVIILTEKLAVLHVRPRS